MLISEFLADFPHLDRDIGAELADVAQQVRDKDRKGGLTITVSIEKKGERVMVQVNGQAKPPKDDPEAGLYFVSPRGGLTKDDPWQTSIDDIDPDTGEIRSADDDNKEHTTQ